MKVEIHQDQNLWGSAKNVVSGGWPEGYLALRTTKDRLVDLFRYPYVAQKTVSGISFRILVGSGQERYLADGEAFEQQMLEEMLHCISPGNIVCDIGAAIGTHTIPAAIKVGPEGIVYSFEPDKGCVKALRKNFAINAIPPCSMVIFETALWSHDCTLIIHTNGVRGESPQVAPAGQQVTKKFNHHFPIQARSLGSMVQEGIISQPDVVKIDVEGAGEKVLTGFGELRPLHIFMEVHPLFGEDRGRVIEILGPAYNLVSEEPREDQLHLHFALNRVI